MMKKLEELAYHKTPLGELVLRRRPEPLLGNIDVYEVKLGEEFLMSSLFTEGEKQLSNIGLAGLEGDLDVVVGGLGLGYTAAAALESKNVKKLAVVEAFKEVISWHRGHLVPMGEVLDRDERCAFVHADFFELAATGFVQSDKERTYDAVLLDIDHTPENYLDKKNGEFYTESGLDKLRLQLRLGGVFALWSDDPPDLGFVERLRTVFGEAKGTSVEFSNPYTGEISINSVYRAVNVK